MADEGCACFFMSGIGGVVVSRGFGYKLNAMSQKINQLGITCPRGFRAAGGAFGIKVAGKPDMTLIVADVPCNAAGLFTTNRMTSAPVLIDQRHLKVSKGKAQAVIVNAGNANASTGKPGERDAIAMCKRVAEHLQMEPSQVLVSSTGVIGRALPMDKIMRGIDTLVTQLGTGENADAAAARGIMTTDLVPKSAGVTLKLGGKTVTLAGIAKGSGMIAPNLATMLVYVTSDVAITTGILQKALKSATRASFNRISVDQHTSPSDTLITLASGLAGNPVIRTVDASYAKFTAALTALCQNLAYQIVKDGEGATKVFRVQITGARDEIQADRVGRAVVNSPLVKCAVHGADPNWGRITTAAGYAGVNVIAEKMSLFIGPKKQVCVFRKGQPTTVGKAPDATLKALMKEKEILFTLDLGMGKARVEWLGCDLSREYIAINADYTT